jgi:hypothetical protein
MREHIFFPWRIAVNHLRNEAHREALASRLRASGAKRNSPSWSVKTRFTKSRATHCHARPNPDLRRTSTANALRPTRATSGVGRARRRQSYLPFVREAVRRTACPICQERNTLGLKPWTVNYRSPCLIISADKLSTLVAFLSRASYFTLSACFAVLAKRPFSWLACAENSLSFTTDVSLLPRERCWSIKKRRRTNVFLPSNVSARSPGTCSCRETFCSTNKSLSH